jgi:hypothetical protein
MNSVKETICHNIFLTELRAQKEHIELRKRFKETTFLKLIVIELTCLELLEKFEG